MSKDTSKAVVRPVPIPFKLDSFTVEPIAVSPASFPSATVISDLVTKIKEKLAGDFSVVVDDLEDDLRNEIDGAEFQDGPDAADKTRIKCSDLMAQVDLPLIGSPYRDLGSNRHEGRHFLCPQNSTTPFSWTFNVQGINYTVKSLFDIEVVPQ